jgi:hypothetical protein
MPPKDSQPKDVTDRSIADRRRLVRVNLGRFDRICTALGFDYEAARYFRFVVKETEKLHTLAQCLDFDT